MPWWPVTARAIRVARSFASVPLPTNQQVLRSADNFDPNRSASLTTFRADTVYGC